MISNKPSGIQLFDPNDHNLLNLVSTRRDSLQLIEPISITDIDLIENDKSIFHPKTQQEASLQQQNDNEINSSSIRLQKVQSDSSSPTQRNSRALDRSNADGLSQDKSLTEGKLSQIRAVPSTMYRNQAQEKSTDLSLKSEIDPYLITPDSLIQKPRAKPSINQEKQQKYPKNSIYQQSNQKNNQNIQESNNSLEQVEEENKLENQTQFNSIKKSIRQQIHHTLLYFLERTNSRRFQNLKPKHLTLIQDKSYFAYVESNKSSTVAITFKCFSLLQWKLLSSTQELKQILKKIIYKIPIIEPTNPLNICINIFAMTYILSLYIIYSFTIFFSFQYSVIIHTIQIASLVISLLEIFSKFFVGIYYKGEIVMNRQLILMRYLKSTFTFDIISLFMILFNVLDITENKIIFQSLFYLKIFSSSDNISKIDHLIHVLGKASNLYQLSKLIIKLIVLCHIISLMYIAIAKVEKLYFYGHNTWLDIQNLNKSEWYVQYVFAFYFALNIIMLNSSSTSNPLETLFGVLIMCSTIGTFALISQCIHDILEEESKKTRELKYDLETINLYMRKNNIKKEWQSKVCNFLEYLYEEKGDMKNNKDAQNVLNRLPFSLREDIQIDINQKVVDSFDFICNTFSEKIKKKTISIIEEECFLPNEIIFKQGSFNDQALYLVQKGKVYLEYVQPWCEPVTFSVQEKNGIFGIKNFFSGSSYDFQARSGDFTTLYKIPRKEFLAILYTSNDDFEQFCVTRDSILLHKNSPFLAVQCKICESKTHAENNCDKVHFQANAAHIISKFQFNQFSQRNDCKRNRRLRTNAIHFVHEMRDVCEKIIQNPEFTPFIEVIELDSYDQNEDSQNSSDQENHSDAIIINNEQQNQFMKESIPEKESEQCSKLNENKGQITFKFPSSFQEGFILEQKEEDEQSPMHHQQHQQRSTQFDNMSFGEQKSLTSLPQNSFQNHQLLTTNSGQLYLKVTKSNLQTSAAYSHNQLSPIGQTKTVKSTGSHVSEIHKSSTLNSLQSGKKSKVHFDENPTEQQKIQTQSKNQKEQKVKRLNRPSSTLIEMRTDYEKLFNLSRKNNLQTENDMYSEDVIKQLTKVNTLIEQQLSWKTPSKEQSSLSQIKSTSDKLQHHLILFEQIRQNILEIQKQTPPVDDTIFSNDFEKMKKYRIYFPLGNFTCVINSYNKNKKQGIKIYKKRGHIRTWSFMNKLQTYSE